MARPSPKHAARLALALLASTALAACGTQEIDLDAGDAQNANIREGAQLFSDRCAGCHTLEAAGAQGSATMIRGSERVDGPNFNTRPEQRDAILYAIRNGGFSGAIMPENIVVGEDAEKVADFLAKYAGRDADRPTGPQAGTP